MPLLTVKILENEFDIDTQGRLIRNLTDSLVATLGENMRPVTWVVVEEVASGAWGVGGRVVKVNPETHKPYLVDEA